MEPIESPLLSTGEVAALIGVSRQHVVDLCDRGDLICVRVGSHRVDAVANVLASQGPVALELRQNSPFAGVISEEARSRVLASFGRHWRREHGRPSKVAPGRARPADLARVTR